MATVGSTLFGAKPPKPPHDANSVRDLEAYVNKLVEMSTPPGLSLAVVKDGNMVYNKSFGLADGPNRVSATPETVYHWGSMTKITTAVSIIQLHERGMLNIDDPVTKSLPDFSVQYPSNSSEHITIRHLLNHSSGIGNPPDILKFIHKVDEPFPDQVELAKHILADNNKLTFEPGAQATYTNLGYTLLGAVVEAVTGQPHKDYVVENIFQPLKMEHTDFGYSDKTRQHAAAGSQPNGSIFSVMLTLMVTDINSLIRETVDGRMWFEHGNADFSGAAGVIGTASDAARFVMAFLNGGELDGARVLSPESVAMMTNEGHIDAKGGPAALYKGVKHGLGWWIWLDGERQRIMHSGDVPIGFSAIMQLYPEEKLGVIVLGNEWAYGISLKGTSPRDSIAQLAANLDW